MANGGWRGDLWRGKIGWCVHPCGQSPSFRDQIQKQKLREGPNPKTKITRGTKSKKDGNHEKFKLKTNFSSIFFLIPHFQLLLYLPPSSPTFFKKNPEKKNHNQLSINLNIQTLIKHLNINPIQTNPNPSLFPIPGIKTKKKNMHILNPIYDEEKPKKIEEKRNTTW